MFHELPPEVRRVVFGECARVLKPGGRFVLLDPLQLGDRPDYDGLLELFPQNYHEPFYSTYITESFEEIAKSSGLTHVHNFNAFISKVMVFDKLWGQSSLVHDPPARVARRVDQRRLGFLRRKPPLSTP
jgi:SAM-dependent methyltransferase